MKQVWPEKFIHEEKIFRHIHAGDRIFIGTGCGEPQYLIQSLLNFVRSNPNAFIDAELMNIVTLSVAPYTDEQFRYNFRLNSFFIGDSIRMAVNKAAADYTPVFLSAVPDLIRAGKIPMDVALIQTSLPDEQGMMNLGVSVDITRTAVDKSVLVVAQANPRMPVVQGDGFLNINEVDFIVAHDEPLLEYLDQVPGDTARKIGSYVARIVEDGSTIQVGYGSLPGAILSSLKDKKHLGVHTELFSDGIADLMARGVIDNSQKSINPGRTIATICMGRKETYDYLDGNPSVEFRTIDYTNNPLIVAQNRRMTAINSALEVDLTGQATAESIGKMFYSGIGGHADFMRGAALAPGGKTILALPSTADDGRISRIVPSLQEGTGVTLTRGDIHYVVTEYGIAYLHGKSIRERAMDLISIAHPRYRPWLIDEAKKRSYIYPDQAFIPGRKGEYPEGLEVHRKTKTGLEILLRPVKISDEPLIKEFFYSLSDESMFQRFLTARKGMPHERLQNFVVIDYTRNKTILAILNIDGKEKIAGLGQYGLNSDLCTADLALVVRDDCHNQGIGSELISYLTCLAKKQGLLGFTGDALARNQPIFALIKKMGFEIKLENESGVFKVNLVFKDEE
ncbi:MAG TPA: GNAT family N-acetyltransferase [Methanotrichaceae archaeon]|nr:GNAT family N-acetyltransferase [Methanotrichaceae archaeon]